MRRLVPAPDGRSFVRLDGPIDDLRVVRHAQSPGEIVGVAVAIVVPVRQPPPRLLLDGVDIRAWIDEYGLDLHVSRWLAVERHLLRRLAKTAIEQFATGGDPRHQWRPLLVDDTGQHVDDVRGVRTRQRSDFQA
jgi:hypothetical protein